MSTRSLGHLFLIWVAAYFSCGLLFAMLYSLTPCGVKEGGVCVKDFESIVYFSFVTEATIGYGDLVPHGTARITAVSESFVGMTLNALVLGIIVFKALRRSSPLVFPKRLVYDPNLRNFRIRFINVDADFLRDVTLNVYLIRKLTDAEVAASGSVYDTLTNIAVMPFNYWSYVPSLRVMGLRSVAHEPGQPAIVAADFSAAIISPADFMHALDRPAAFLPSLEIVGSGYFESTGDRFFVRGVYSAADIVCGEYVEVNNNEIEAALVKRGSSLSASFGHVLPRDPASCDECRLRSCGFGPM